MNQQGPGFGSIPWAALAAQAAQVASQNQGQQGQGKQGGGKKKSGGGGLGGLMDLFSGAMGGTIGGGDAPSLGSGVIDEAALGSSVGDSSTHIPNFTGPGMSPVFGAGGFVQPSTPQNTSNNAGYQALVSAARNGEMNHLARPADGHPYAIAQPVASQANGHPYATGLGAPQSEPSSLASLAPPVGGDWVTKVKKFEGYYPKSYWDYKQHTVGYGTRAKYAGERIDKAEAERRLSSELASARRIVDGHAPNAPEGIKNALTSLTFNAGSKWTRSGLGRLVAQGDYDGALQRFLQYNKAGGKTLPGLVNRRREEAKWWKY